MSAPSGATRPLPSDQRGFTFLAVMFSVVLIGTTIGTASRQWKTVVQREKEAELLFRGQAIKRAIDFYYRTSRAGFAQYPRTLDELIKDPGSPAVRRYLRKIYPDPMTGGEWILLKDATGRVKGVRSGSEEAPLKTANFPEEFKSFEGKKKYSEWVFESKPQAVPGAPPSEIPLPPPTP
jgi:type II secretory pathway pseudopilin PulG